MCGLLYIAHSANSKYCCEKCKKDAEQLNQQIAYAREKEKLLARRAQKGSALSKLAMQARQCGMTYGQYVGINKL